MIHVDQEYSREIECEYKGEKYRVRDNGAIFRLARENKSKRPKDEIWTFGEKIDRGYAKFCNESVHRIVAIAFLGKPPTKQHVVDHIDTNRQNNRPENLRWITRLENILLNPYTKAKIEYCCGSVESFLADPSQLRGYESEDSNFTWMRAVSTEEAQNTLENWSRLFNKPRPEIKSKENPIGEWIFQQNFSKRNYEEIFANFDFDKATSSITETTPREKIPISPEPVKTRNKQKAIPVSKTEFMEFLLNICESAGINYKKYYKADCWKSDILVSLKNRRIAFSAFNSVDAAEKSLALMKNAGVEEVYGLLLSKKKEVSSNFPCFNLYHGDSCLEVSAAGNKLPFKSFVKNVLENKIEHLTRAQISAVDILFVEKECYFCKAHHSVFFARHLIDENGKKYDITEIDYKENSNMPDLQFGDEILELVKQHIKKHPEEKIEMGEVKKRHSKTMNEEYMSFGCPQCDSIVGQHYLEDMEAEAIYETNEKLMTRIQLKAPFEIFVNQWIIKD